MFPKQAPVFTCVQCRSFKNTVGMREIARQIRDCCLKHSQFGRYQNLPFVISPPKVEIIMSWATRFRTAGAYVHERCNRFLEN